MIHYIKDQHLLRKHAIINAEQEQTEARVATFNFSVVHGDRLYLQPTHGETEKDGGGDEKGERDQEREKSWGDEWF